MKKIVRIRIVRHLNGCDRTISTGYFSSHPCREVKRTIGTASKTCATCHKI